MATNSVIKLNIEMALKGERQVGEMTIGLKELETAVNKVQAASERVKMEEVIKTSAALGMAVQGLINALDFAAQGFKDFDDAMRAANTMAGKRGKEFEDLKDTITELGKEIPKTRDELANGLYQAISNGVPEDNWIDFLRDSAKASVGGMADLGGVVTVTSTIIKNYGLAWEEAADIQEKIQKTAQYGVTSFEQLQQALPKVTGNAATLGVTIDEMMATFATLTGVSGNTAEVATQLAAIFTALIKPSTQATKMAAEMGIQFDAAAIKASGGFQNFLSDLDASVKAYSAASGVLEQEVYGKLFGSAESLRALGPLTGQLSETYALNVDRMAEDSDALGMAFEDMANTADAKSQLMRNRWAELTDVAGSFIVKIQPMMNFTATLTQSVSGVVALSTAFKAVYVSAMRTKAIPAVFKALSLILGSTGRAVIVLRDAFNMSTASAKALGIAIKGAIISTGVGVALVAITTLIEKFAAKADKAADKANRLKDASKALADDLSGSFKSAAADAQSALDEELNKLKELIDSKGDATDAVKHLNEEYGASFGTYSTAAEWYDILTRKSKEYAKALGYEAIAREAGRKVAELEMEKDILVEQRQEKKKSVNRLKANGKYYNGSYKSKEALSVEREIKELDTKISEQDTLISQANTELTKAQSKAEAITATLKPNKTETKGTNATTGKGTGTGSKTRTETPDPVFEEVISREMVTLADYKTAISDLEKLREKASIDTIGIIDREIEKIKEAQSYFEYAGVHPLRASLEAAPPSLLPVKMELPITPVLDMTAQNNLQKEVKATLDKMPKAYDWAKEAWGDVTTLSSAMESLNKVLDKDASAWDRISSAVQAAMGFYESITGLMSMVQMAQEASKAAKAADTQATNENTTANVANAASQFMAAHAWIPWVGVGLAVASVATMVATMAGLPKFADGGIAYGPTVGIFGEYSGASNNPEVVAPLDRLKDLIGVDNGISGEVEFKISGETLYGVLQKRRRRVSRS